MTAVVGHPTLRLIRVRIGSLLLGDLKPGEWRTVEAPEVGER
jgi:23S rRNA pseudouridine2457 synthase